MEKRRLGRDAWNKSRSCHNLHSLPHRGAREWLLCARAAHAHLVSSRVLAAVHRVDDRRAALPLNVVEVTLVWVEGGKDRPSKVRRFERNVLCPFHFQQLTTCQTVTTLRRCLWW